MEQFGRVACYASFVLLLMALALVCIRRLRQPGRRIGGELPLLLLIAAGICLFGSMTMRGQVPGIVPSIVSLLGTGLLFSSLVGGIVALIRKPRPADTNVRRFRWPAVLAVGVSAFVAGISCFLAFASLMEAQRQTAASIGPGAAPPASRPTQVASNEELNFRFRVPDSPWRRSPVKPPLTLLITRDSPDMTFIVIAEAMRYARPLEQLAANCIQTFRNKSPDAVVGPTRAETVAGINGYRFDSTATNKGQAVAYSHWVGARNGFVWQLITGGIAEPSYVSRAAEELCARFELIDPTRIAEGFQGEPAPKRTNDVDRWPAPEPVEFEAYNFRYAPPADGWAEVPADRRNPDASVALRRRDRMQSFMVIAENDMSEHTTETFAEAIVESLQDDPTVTAIGPLQQEVINGVAGLRFDVSGKLETIELQYAYWVAAHNGFAWQLISVGQRASSEEVRAAAAEAFQGFERIDPDRVFEPAEDVQATNEEDAIATDESPGSQPGDF